jgi:deazaflavin-dependent oxidoreductase (nitroreductase family)
MANGGNRVEKIPRFVWKLLKLPSRILYGLGLGRFQGRFVLLLTTTGRKSGKPRVTPLQYDQLDDDVGAARGVNADWFRNIQADPEVQVQVKGRRFRGLAEPITDPLQIADFLELRLARHPKMVGAIMRSAGLPPMPSRAQLESYAAKRAMVIIRPLDEEQAQD